VKEGIIIKIVLLACFIVVLLCGLAKNGKNFKNETIVLLGLPYLYQLGR